MPDRGAYNTILIKLLDPKAQQHLHPFSSHPFGSLRPRLIIVSADPGHSKSVIHDQHMRMTTLVCAPHMARYRLFTVMRSPLKVGSYSCVALTALQSGPLESRGSPDCHWTLHTKGGERGLGKSPFVP